MSKPRKIELIATKNFRPTICRLDGRSPGDNLKAILINFTDCKLGNIFLIIVAKYCLSANIRKIYLKYFDALLSTNQRKCLVWLALIPHPILQKIRCLAHGVRIKTLEPIIELSSFRKIQFMVVSRKGDSFLKCAIAGFSIGVDATNGEIKIMKPQLFKIIFFLSGLSITLIALPAHAGNSAHLQQLINTQKCDQCDLSGFNLSQRVFSGVSLKNANLTGADLGGVVMQKANLAGANLTGAIMHRIDLSEANLTGANFAGSDMKGAQLHLADMSRADFQKTDLSRANLVKVKTVGLKMAGAKLVGAHMSIEDFKGADLSGATMPDGKIHPQIAQVKPIMKPSQSKPVQNKPTAIQNAASKPENDLEPLF